MAETPVAGNSNKAPGKIRSKKISTRVDLTPMVDLGFLLITFFMLTAVLSKPQIMALVMPDMPDGDPPQVADSKVLTLLLGAHDKVYWYEGIEDPHLDSTDYSNAGLRKVILDKMDKVQNKWGLEDYRDIRTDEAKKGSRLFVIIKSTRDARYKNLVDALDEMAVCRVRYYTLLDISAQEEQFISNPALGMNFTPEQQVRASIR